MLNFFKKYTIYFLAFAIYLSIRWVARNFGDVSFEQALFHLQLGVGNLSDSDPELIAYYYKRGLYIPAAQALIFAVIHTFHSKIIHACSAIYKFFSQSASNNRLTCIFQSKHLHIQMLILALVYGVFKFSVIGYMKDQLFVPTSDFYAEHYIPPASVTLEKSAHKNLILIYVESLENTYNRDDLFKTNLIRTLEPDYLDGKMFTKWRQLPGTSWTIAGIIGTQCGIPLKPSLGGHNDGEPQNSIFEVVTAFLPNAICLGDILKTQGYKNIYMQGASLKFAGKDGFFLTHGYDEAYGRDEFLKMNNKLAVSNWGIYDDDLLKLAKERIDELESNPNQPYNLTLLTVDTHQPVGHLSRTCKQRGVKKFRGIVRCTSEMVSELTEYIKSKDYLKNTTVVIVGDHLAMTNPVIKKIRKADERFIFNNYITNDSSLLKNRNEFVHFDHFPTILESIGFKVPGGKLALGISGFNEEKLTAEQTQDRLADLEENVLRYSNIYQSFWLEPEANRPQSQ